LISVLFNQSIFSKLIQVRSDRQRLLQAGWLPLLLLNKQHESSKNVTFAAGSRTLFLTITFLASMSYFTSIG